MLVDIVYDVLGLFVWCLVWVDLVVVLLGSLVLLCFDCCIGGWCVWCWFAGVRFGVVCGLVGFGVCYRGWNVVLCVLCFFVVCRLLAFGLLIYVGFWV